MEATEIRHKALLVQVVSRMYYNNKDNVANGQE